MMEIEQPQFIELLGDLFGAHSRNVKADLAGGYWKGLRRMSLEEFRAVVDASIEKLQHTERGVANPPTVAELWDMHRRSRALPIKLEPPADHDNLDGWDRNSNLLLLNYITQGLVQKTIYAQKATRDSGRYVGAERVAIMAKYKREWAADMRRNEERGGTLDGKACWFEYMEIAEREIQALIEAEERAVAA